MVPRLKDLPPPDTDLLPILITTERIFIKNITAATTELNKVEFVDEKIIQEKSVLGQYYCNT